MGWARVGGEHVATVSNSNVSCFRVVLSLVELRVVLTIFRSQFVTCKARSQKAPSSVTEDGTIFSNRLHK